ncbi:MAG: hypothetical protein IT258_00960 [Saprospiraceae bacterium]|nr:hypothetical protein [Saprospiraceae bacterium]
MKRQLLLIATLLYLSTPVIGQVEQRNYRQYGTQQYLKQQIEIEPERALKLGSMEEFITGYIDVGDANVVKIPLVFHVLYNGGTPSVSLEQINQQLEVLNQDFGLYTQPIQSFIYQKVQDFYALAIDTKISFCIPENIDLGQNGLAIEYLNTPIQEWPISDEMKSVEHGGSAAWYPERCLNIWICDLKDNIAGFSQMPFGPMNTDGIVIDKDFIFDGLEDSDSPYDSGKTLTHLIGNYLGLYDLWSYDEPCKDDYVDDTPLHDAPNFGLGTHYYHVSLCTGEPQAEMVMNYMDNTDDVALNMFTNGQKHRMMAVLSEGGPRHALIANPECAFSFTETIDRSQPTQSDFEGNRDEHYMEVYPNPSSDVFNVKLTSNSTSQASLRISSTVGTVKWEQAEQILLDGDQLLRIDCSTWPDGIYNVTAIWHNGEILTQRVLISKP